MTLEIFNNQFNGIEGVYTFVWWWEYDTFTSIFTTCWEANVTKPLTLTTEEPNTNGNEESNNSNNNDNTDVGLIVGLVFVALLLIALSMFAIYKKKTSPQTSVATVNSNEGIAAHVTNTNTGTVGGGKPNRPPPPAPTRH